MTQLPRVAILGGGVGAVTAALELSRAGWQKEFGSITIYQQGWRLGGKGASGRGRDGRIEEHGLHIWFGFYENAFRLLRECHEELDRIAATTGPPREPLVYASVPDSFRPVAEITLTDHDGCCWKHWRADFFEFGGDRPWADPDPRGPGERPEDWSVAFYAARCLHLAADFAVSLTMSSEHATILAGPAAAATTAGGALAHGVQDVLGALTGGPHDVLQAAAHALDEVAMDAAGSAALADVLELVLRALDFALDALRGRLDDVIRASDKLRRAWYMVDLLVAIVRGVLEDGVLESDSFAVIDDVEFRAWLMGHGARRESVDCAFIRAVVYDLAFAYRGGDPQRPCAGAGTALRGLMRAFFTYRGALMWKMNAAMGDVVFAPYYELLIKRGVNVEFFHRVEAVRAKGGVIEQIEIDVQAVVDPATEPLDYLRDPGVPGQAVWPARPTVTMTGTAATLGAEAFESFLADRQTAKKRTLVLQRGAVVDGFEHVVFGLPIGCVPYVAADLVAQSPAWSNAAKRVETVATQALQLWLDVPAANLGAWPEGIVVGGYVEPYDTWADMSQLVEHENVKGCATVAYFCNVLADGPAPPRGHAGAWLAQQQALVRAQALRFLEHDIRFLWPGAVDPISGVLQWDRLVAPTGVVGEARLDHQYLRANVEPSERYVLSVPGSSAHRIAPGATGFANLFAAGDWTACGLDAGCVEAATVSGLLAANALRATVTPTATPTPIVGHPGP